MHLEGKTLAKLVSIPVLIMFGGYNFGKFMAKFAKFSLLIYSSWSYDIAQWTFLNVLLWPGLSMKYSKICRTFIYIPHTESQKMAKNTVGVLYPTCSVFPDLITN